MTAESQHVERPDLSAVTPDVLAYVEALEAEIETLRASSRSSSRGSSREEANLEPSEPPTTINVITISKKGVAKRTPRHFYTRQRRGGMGIFDLETSEDDPPALLLTADESAGVVLVTNQARAFRIPAGEIVKGAVRSRGESLLQNVSLTPGEELALAFPDRGGSQVVLVSQRGQVRRMASHYFGDKLQPGTVLYNVNEGGPPAAACWTRGDGDLFIATRGGKAIRFAERQVPVRGCLGLRVDQEDAVIGVASVAADGGVFLATDDGKGTVRLMTGFNANKAPGAGGKVAMKTDALLGATSVTEESDVFLISRLGKMIRFSAGEVPPKEGVVQGVNCMSLRADECVAFTVS